MVSSSELSDLDTQRTTTDDDQYRYYLCEFRSDVLQGDITNDIGPGTKDSDEDKVRAERPILHPSRGKRDDPQSRERQGSRHG
jgi:hypothetical protein